MNLLSLVEQMTGVEFKFHSKTGGGIYVGPCPFCGGDDRFTVWIQGKVIPHWWCRQCEEKGGSLKLYSKFNGCTIREAEERLREMGYPIDNETSSYTPGQRTSKPKPLPPSKSDLIAFHGTIEDVERWHQEGREKAIAYYGQWGISEDAVDAHLLGYSQEHNGYSIPHWWLEGDKYILRGVKFRHITDDHKRRFSTLPDSITRGTFNMQYVSNPDGTREGPVLDYVLIVEAEKDAILLEDMGYPAISYLPEIASDAYLDYMLHNVIQRIIIYDADGGRGMNRAIKLTNLLRTRPTMVSTEQFWQKSPSDVVKAYDRDVLDLWLRDTLEIDPTL